MRFLPFSPSTGMVENVWCAISGTLHISAASRARLCDIKPHILKAIVENNCI